MRIFDHPGCHSGQCIWQQWGMARLVTDCISNMKNHIFEQQRERQLHNEARRLVDEHDMHQAVDTRPETTLDSLIVDELARMVLPTQIIEGEDPWEKIKDMLRQRPQKGTE